MDFRPSANIARLKESATLAVAAKARALKAQGVQLLDLGQGEPDFDTPAFIREAAAEALNRGATRYTATEGILPLREAIAADANRQWAAGDISPAEVMVSNGSKQSLYNACVCCFGPGDEVLIPTPSWTSYYEMVELARATGVPVLGDPANSLKVSAAQLAAAATPRTKGLMLNSPSNPTGAVYTREELAAILALIPLAVGLNINFVTLFTDWNPHIFFGGDNALFWKPLSWTIIWGLIFAFFMTLLMVPGMYIIAERLKRPMNGFFRGRWISFFGLLGPLFFIFTGIVYGVRRLQGRPVWNGSLKNGRKPGV